DAGATLLKDLGGRPTLLVKDPRLCLTYGFWAPLLPGPLPLMMVRRPSSVIQSLLKRDGVEQAYALWLWACYNRRALDSASQNLAGLVFYEDFLADPVSALRPWSESLGLGGALDSPTIQSALAKVVKHDLNHAPGEGALDGPDQAYASLLALPAGSPDRRLGLKALVEGVLRDCSEGSPDIPGLAAGTPAYFRTQRLLQLQADELRQAMIHGPVLFPYLRQCARTLKRFLRRMI
ncbi:MAG TPA: hypothetical protein VNZ67_06815, partial [bacterium]|nr:hypothetical protein [bacterium]